MQLILHMMIDNQWERDWGSVLASQTLVTCEGNGGKLTAAEAATGLRCVCDARNLQVRAKRLLFVLVLIAGCFPHAPASNGSARPQRTDSRSFGRPSQMRSSPMRSVFSPASTASRAGGSSRRTSRRVPEALHLAIEGGRRDLFDLLLEHGADVNGTNDQYDLWSPLMIAMNRDRADMRDELLGRGATSGWSGCCSRLAPTRRRVTSNTTGHL
jgi:Ankyrin repeat